MRSIILFAVLAVIGAGCQTSPSGGGAAGGTGGINAQRAAAERGDAEAQYALGVAYYKGTEVPKDDAAAVSWFRRAADQGSVKAQFDLGLMHGYGLGVPRDPKVAEYWLGKASAQGHPEAPKWLEMARADTIGKAQPEPTEPDSDDPSAPAASGDGKTVISGRSLAVVQASAEAGDRDALFELGTMYGEGQGVKQDYAASRKWFAVGAAAGDARCQDKLGVLYATARGGPQDLVLAMQWFEKSAAQDHPSAWSNLGLMYLRGRGVPKDEAKAAAAFLKAAEHGIASAQFRYGVMVEKGQGVEKDLRAAYRWYRLSAEQNYADGQDRLAWMMATCPLDDLRDGPSGIHYATLANQQTGWLNAGYLETLAAAHAEAGQFDQAVRRQQEVVDQLNAVIAGGADSARLGRLGLYQNKLPYRSR